jgi:hypothetical protein
MHSIRSVIASFVLIAGCDAGTSETLDPGGELDAGVDEEGDAAVEASCTSAGDYGAGGDLGVSLSEQRNQSGSMGALQIYTAVIGTI